MKMNKGELLADPRSELSFADFEEYVRNALPDNIKVFIKKNALEKA